MRKLLLGMLFLVLAGGLVFAADRVEKPKATAPALAQSAAPNATGPGWYKLPALLNGTQNWLKVQYDADALWIYGYRGSSPREPKLWRSTDNGYNWTSSTPSTVRGIFSAANKDVALYATFDGKILKSTDSGATFTQTYVYGDGSGFFDAMSFIDQTTAVAIGDAVQDINGNWTGPHIIRSTDAGDTWTVIDPPALTAGGEWYATASYGGHIMAVVGNEIWADLYPGSGQSVIVHSTDAGATWDAWTVEIPGAVDQANDFRSLFFADALVGYGTDFSPDGVETNYWYKTTDGGHTWTGPLKIDDAAPQADQQVYSVRPISGTNILVATGENPTAGKGASWWSTDNGTSWTPLRTPGGRLYNSHFKSETEGFAVGVSNAVRFTLKGASAVTFTVNSATVPDTLPVAGQTMQIRGGTGGTDDGISPITWGNDLQNNMTRVGGDYWSKTLDVQVGDTLRYKYVVAYPTGTGWEQGVDPEGHSDGPNSNRFVVATEADTTVAVEFWNNGANDRAQFFRPWDPVADNFMNVYFRVSMSGPMSTGAHGFNPDVDGVGIRGGYTPTGWDATYFLTRESPATNGDGYTIAANTFWSGRLALDKSTITEGQNIQYKFLIGDAWGRDETDLGGNRSFNVPAGFKDTTLAWVFFNNERPTGRANSDTMIVTFRANLAKAASSGGFTVGVDTLQVQTGWFGTSTQVGRAKNMQQVIGSIYQVTDTIVTSKGQLLDYQYYVYRNGQTVRESYYNYSWAGSIQSEAERRQTLVPATGTAFTVLDTATSVTQDRRQPQFANSRRLAQNVLVTWTVDLRPAIYQVLKGDTLNDIQGDFDITPADVNSLLGWGVWINGPATGGWTTWGSTLNTTDDKKMYDDGTNGDLVAGDSIFTRQILASPDSVLIGDKSVVGQTFKYGIRGGDNEGGSGGFGNNHTENIIDTAPTYTLETQFGSINPAFYDAWDYDTGTPITGVIDENQPLVFSLAQNYPNPFNPSTRIEYSIPNQSKVVLKVYNLVGQEVATLVNDVLPAGIHSVRFDANKLATGFYVYRLSAGDFTSVKKMLLLK